MDKEKPLTVEQASDYLGIAVGTLKNKCYNNEIPYHKPAGKMYFFPKELDQWVRGEWEKQTDKQ
jgi:excisionase family DNA binding protein